ncbi:hypothetical protein T261_1799 [Streptomyces lydicus]|nr:hypothetical protein T261_1799 [Streptomyces lydicus]
MTGEGGAGEFLDVIAPLSDPRAHDARRPPTLQAFQEVSMR